MERRPKREEAPLTETEILGAVGGFVRDRRSGRARDELEEEEHEIKTQDNLDQGN